MTGALIASQGRSAPSRSGIGVDKGWGRQRRMSGGQGLWKEVITIKVQLLDHRLHSHLWWHSRDSCPGPHNVGVVLCAEVRQLGEGLFLEGIMVVCGQFETLRYHHDMHTSAVGMCNRKHVRCSSAPRKPQPRYREGRASGCQWPIAWSRSPGV